jgi:hypothetical protein
MVVSFIHSSWLRNTEESWGIAMALRGLMLLGMVAGLAACGGSGGDRPATLSGAADLKNVSLPATTDPNFCQVVQQYMSSTELESSNTLFTDMPEYRHSKPLVDPLETFQVVSYAGAVPIMISCKIKGAAHLRSAHGAEAAGTQRFCPEITLVLQAKAVAALQAMGEDAAAASAAAFIIDNNEPFMTGRDYLSDFELSYMDPEAGVHLQSPGLFHDYDSWTTIILPENFEGQAYCHLPSREYIMALARGDMEPGTVMTTADDAPVTPQ